MEALAAKLAEQDIAVVRFEFAYMAQRRTSGRRRPPDRKEALMNEWQALVETEWSSDIPLFIGGKSMGGRMATLWATEFPCRRVRGVVCFGYPFHPPSKPQSLRSEHLARLPVPALVVQGTRDRLGDIGLVQQLDLPAKVRLEWIPSGDHDLKPLQKSGLTQEQALHIAAEATARFVKEVLAATESDAQQPVDETEGTR